MRVGRVVLFALLVAVVAFAALSFVAQRGLYLSTTDLRPSEAKAENVSTAAQYVDLYGSGGDVVATAGANLDSVGDSVLWMNFSVSHAEDVQLEDVSLAIRSAGGIFPPQVSLTASSGDWPPFVFGPSRDGQSVLLSVQRLGVMGSGTIQLQFLVVPAAGQSGGVIVDADLTFHRKAPIILTRQRGRVTLRLDVAPRT